MNGMLLRDTAQIEPGVLATFAAAMGSERVAQALLDDERLRPRLLERLFEHAGIDTATPFADGRTTQAAATVLADPQRIERICGLVVYASVLRKHVSRREYDALAAHFPPAELALACRLRELHIQHGENSIDFGRMPELVASAGRNVVAAWVSGLPERARKEFALTSAHSRYREFGRGMRLDPQGATRILLAVAAAAGGRDA